MSTDQFQGDPCRPQKIKRFNPKEYTAGVDTTPEYLNFLAMLCSMGGLALKIKSVAWIAVFCACMGFANARSNDDSKHSTSAIMLAASAVLMCYMHNPEPMQTFLG